MHKSLIEELLGILYFLLFLSILKQCKYLNDFNVAKKKAIKTHQ